MAVDVVRPVCSKCGEVAFELRMLKDEGVATVCCAACGRHYLLLDSADYWFDVIQSGYPKLTTCTCKNARFGLQLEYHLREGGEDDGEVERVIVATHCAACRKQQRRMNIEIDYSPSRRLREKPLTPCKNPQILFDLKELTLYATAADMARVADYLAEAGCSFAGVVREGDDWFTRDLSPGQAAEVIAKKVSYLQFYSQLYAMPRRLAMTDAVTSAARKEDAFWKRREVIKLDAPFTMVWGSRQGSLYYVRYANEYVEGQSVVPKSSRFRKLTAGLVEWLGQEFVTWRGSDCFDNEKVHRRLFGSKFAAKIGRSK